MPRSCVTFWKFRFWCTETAGISGRPWCLHLSLFGHVFPKALKFSFLATIPLLNPWTYIISGDLNALHPKSNYLYICQNSSDRDAWVA